jgi:hypothetical protein
MKKEKLSLKGIKNVLSKTELRKIMAGGSPGNCSFCGTGGYNCCQCTDGLHNFYREACGNSSCYTLCTSQGLSYVQQVTCSYCTG